jgi:hypothetical protein
MHSTKARAARATRTALHRGNAQKSMPRKNLSIHPVREEQRMMPRVKIILADVPTCRKSAARNA